MTAPSWWSFVLIGLGVFRCTRLVGWDDLTIGLRARVTGVSDAEYGDLVHAVEREKALGRDPFVQKAVRLSERRYYLAKLVRCPWCAGWWLSVAVWLAWLEWSHAVVAAAVPFALSAVVGLVAKQWDP